MIGLALSGGGSRAIAFHLGCLRALNDLRILDRVNVVSTISGGSVIGAYYAYTPKKSFEEFETDIRKYLRDGLQFKILIELLKPWHLLPSISNMALVQLQELISVAFPNQPRFKRYISRSDMFYRVLRKTVFADLKMNSPRRGNINIVIGASELRTGSAFRFGNDKSGSWRHGEIVGGNLDVSFAVAASAAYPILLPAFDRTWLFQQKDKTRRHRVLLTDGGVYDNLGLQVLEPGRDPEYSLHTYPCQYLIVCNAGYGQEAGTDIPLGFMSRVTKSFEVVHKRVQDAAMGHLHHLQETASIRGFAMPYLGQQDHQLPWKPNTLVSREEVLGYPTNFAAMADEWIDKLSNRGEQLTRLLVSYYMPELL